MNIDESLCIVTLLVIADFKEYVGCSDKPYYKGEGQFGSFKAQLY